MSGELPEDYIERLRRDGRRERRMIFLSGLFAGIAIGLLFSLFLNGRVVLYV